MNNYKAKADQWDELEGWAGHGSTVACILELRDRVMALEAQSNHPVIPDSSTSPPVATDEELWATDEDLWKLWAEFGFAAFRIIYNLGVAHGQASSREVADPAPVVPRLKEQALLAIDTAVADERLSADVASVVRRALEALPND